MMRWGRWRGRCRTGREVRASATRSRPSTTSGAGACWAGARSCSSSRDGWDRGEPELLGREAARLQRSCHRLIWLNPLLGSETYAPLTRGMQAALPFVDDHLPVHNLASLEDLADRLNRIPQHRPARRQRPPVMQEEVAPPEPPSPHGASCRQAGCVARGPAADVPPSSLGAPLAAIQPAPNRRLPS